EDNKSARGTRHRLARCKCQRLPRYFSFCFARSMKSGRCRTIAGGVSCRSRAALTWRQAMPFDGIGFACDRVNKIDEVIRLLATADRWCKTQFETPDGRYCLRGAIRAVEGAEVLKPIV